MRLSRIGLAALLFIALPSPASADSFSWTRSDKLVEKRHEVAITMHRDHATMRVRRTVWNGGERSDQATFFLSLPDGAAATGLRTLAYTDGKPTWYAGELMEAEAAAKKYSELTGLGAFYPKDPALLSWRSQGLLALQVFPCFPNQEKTVEYTLTLPTQWTKGQSVLELPALGTKDVVPTVVVQSDLGRVFVDGEQSAQTDLSQGRVFALEPRGMPVWSGLLANVEVDSDTTLAAYRVSAAKAVSTLPDKARIVILFDASRSIKPEQLAAFSTAANAALSNFASPDVKVHLASFDRTVHASTKGFVSVADAQKTLEAPPSSRGNGSEVEVALRYANDLLATAPVDAARRVILFSDLATRATLTPEVAAKSAPRGGVLHLVSLNGFGLELNPEEESPWAAVPRATGGLYFAGQAGPAEDVSTLKKTFEELVRPTRIHKVSLRSGDTSIDTAPPELAEGEGFEWRSIDATKLAELTFSGELWSKPISNTISADAGFGRRAAALAFGNELHYGLSDEQAMTLALHGRAVSPVTSYLAIEPGVRPSTDGLESGEGGGGRGSGIGLGSIGTIGFGAGSAFDPADELTKLLTPLAASCGGGITSVTVESTWQEVVEVTVVANGDANDTRKSCMTKAVWDVLLPSGFGRHSHLTTGVGPL